MIESTPFAGNITAEKVYIHKTSMNRRLDQICYAVLFKCLLLVVLSIVAVGAIATPAWASDYTKETLINVDFSNRVLTDATFTKANLRNSNFSHADLRGVSLFGANLEFVNLEGANLSNATLDTAKFTKANLTNAVLEGAFAFNAKFDGAIIDGADFTDVLVRQDVQKQLCKIATGTNPTTGRETRDTLLCP
ncbi:MAG: pentapeptide repeat-containing protein [Crinalium sp.]